MPARPRFGGNMKKVLDLESTSRSMLKIRIGNTDFASHLNGGMRNGYGTDEKGLRAGSSISFRR